MSETLRLGIILAVSGGFMDAYSYLFRDHVFANAQTGNMLLLGVNISRGNFAEAVRYLFPVIAFTIGIIISDVIRYNTNDKGKLHWRQNSVLFEALSLFAVAFIPTEYNLFANSLTSLACGIQVESFRKIHGSGIATTMCIGNLRSGTENLCSFVFYKNKENLGKAMLYYGIILSFIIGAVLGSIAIEFWGEKSILVCSFMLALAFLIMFKEKS